MKLRVWLYAFQKMVPIFSSIPQLREFLISTSRAANDFTVKERPSYITKHQLWKPIFKLTAQHKPKIQPFREQFSLISTEIQSNFHFTETMSVSVLWNTQESEVSIAPKCKDFHTILVFPPMCVQIKDGSPPRNTSCLEQSVKQLPITSRVSLV